MRRTGDAWSAEGWDGVWTVGVDDWARGVALSGLSGCDVLLLLLVFVAW